ncbi:MAG: hypothetical protein Q8L37_03745 [Candidatus Gottesmanbacteria bacterium]|nr:hypothetical protein [Candidatus Gottesmanbacteria bacterium]
MTGVLDRETTMKSVAQEVARFFHIQSYHAVLPPPDPYCTEEDEQLVTILQDTLSEQNSHQHSDAILHIVAWSLTVPTAIMSARIIHAQCAQHNIQFRGIGCGFLTIPNEFQGPYQLFSDETWNREAGITPFVPLYRCTAQPADCLQA